MYRMALSLACMITLAGLVSAEEPKPTSKVTGTYIFPKDVDSFDGRLLEIRLYKYDPRIADKAADLVEKIEIKEFKHVKGAETKKEFKIGADAALELDRNYYVTFFVLSNGVRTHMGRCEHDKNGIGKVLTNGAPDKVTVVFHQLK